MLTYRVEDGRLYGYPGAAYVVTADRGKYERVIGSRETARNLCDAANFAKASYQAAIYSGIYPFTD